MSFVHYLRMSGLEILTTGGPAADNQAGVAAARDYKTAGATLDTYTAITAAEMDCLDILRTWFGALSVPASTIEAIEKSIAQAADGLGKETMSIGWKDGEFFREAVNDDILHHQIQQLETIKSKIVDHCEVAAVVLPNDLPQEVAQFTRTTGRDGMDAMYLAASRGELLVSEDLFYRTIAASLTKIDGTWLQVVFLAALVAGQMDRTRYAKACAQLAYRRHGTLWLDDVALSMISEECSAHEFAAACHYIGSSNAHMWSHTVLVTRFLRRIWYRPSIGLKRENLTSTVIGALLRPRREDWHYCLAVLWMAAEGNSSLRGYLVAWIHGHFLPVAPINAAKSELRLFLRQKFRPALSAASARAISRRILAEDRVKLDFGDRRRTKLMTIAENEDIRSKCDSLGKRARRRKFR